MKLYLYTNKKYNIKRSNNNDNYKIKANCLKERRLITMINFKPDEESKTVDV